MKTGKSIFKSIFALVLMMGFSLIVNAQAIKVTGTVTDGKEPLTGCSVQVKGTTTGTSADIDGKFTLNAKQGDILVFTYIGFVTKQLPAAAVMNVVLEPEAIALQETVVVGYGVQKKSDVTGAIVQVKSEDIQNRSIARADQALQGKTAGVQIINTSGAPGSGSTIRIRGYSSNGSSDPLFVVDGLRVSDIGFIDPNNIESIEVLKDAASAAIYGAQAGNGVILISTKTGSKMKEGKVFYDFQYSINNLRSIPKVLNAQEYIQYMLEGNLITQATFDSKYDGHTDTDWTKVAFEPSLMEKHNFGMQGANDKGSYYVSMNWLKQDGIVKGDKDVYTRLTLTSNIDQKIKSWLKVSSTNIIEKYERSSVSENSEYGSLLAAVLTMDPLTPDVYNPGSLPVSMQTLVDGGKNLLKNSKGQYYGISQFYEDNQAHPMVMRDNSTTTGGGINVNGTLAVDFTPIKGFTFTSRLGYRTSHSSSKTYGPEYYANSISYRTKPTISRSANTSFYYQWENFANYAFSIDQHRINLMAGMSYSDSYNDYVNASVDKLTKYLPQFIDLGYAASDAVKTVGGGYGVSRQMSYFGRGNWSYKDKYTFEATLRADAGDIQVLSKQARWGIFPAASAGWIISREDFFAGLNKTISYLKLRASWGQAGSTRGLGGFGYQSSIASSWSYPFTNDIAYQIGSSLSGMSNPDLKWETSEQINFGFDLRMFKDKLNFTFEWYNKETKDLLVSVTPPYETGVSSTTINAGNVRNQGMDFEIGYRGQVGKDFTYNVRANLATLNNKVTYLDPSISRINGAGFLTTSGVTAFEVGKPVWFMRGYKFKGVDPANGNPIFEDLTPDGLLNDADRTQIGCAIPDFTYGVTINANYKGFDFVLFGTGSQGNDIFSLLNKNDRTTGNKMHYLYADRWTPTNTTGSVPKPNSNNYFTHYILSDAAVFDGSFFKIKQIQFGYNLPQRWLKKAAISSLRLYVSLDDWFTFTSYPGMDPEASAGSTSSMGLDKGAYPISKKTLFGVNISF